MFESFWFGFALGVLALPAVAAVTAAVLTRQAARRAAAVGALPDRWRREHEYDAGKH